MKKKTDLQTELDNIVKQEKIKKAKNEAKNIYNYNKWKEEHDRLVDQELKKLEQKNKTSSKGYIIFALIIIAILIAILYTDFNSYPHQIFKNL